MLFENYKVQKGNIPKSPLRCKQSICSRLITANFYPTSCLRWKQNKKKNNFIYEIISEGYVITDFK